MGLKVQRKIIRIGDTSLAVTIPKPWVEYNNLKAGDVLEISGENELIIKPKLKVEEKGAWVRGDGYERNVNEKLAINVAINDMKGDDRNGREKR